MKNQIYEAGRSTEGYEWGTQVENTDDAKEGDVLALLSHQFQSVNLIIIVDAPYGLFQNFHKGMAGRLYYRYYDPAEGCATGEVMGLWGWEVLPVRPMTLEIYRVVPDAGGEK